VAGKQLGRKGPGVLVNSKFNMSQKCALVATKAKGVLFLDPFYPPMQGAETTSKANPGTSKETWWLLIRLLFFITQGNRKKKTPSARPDCVSRREANWARGSISSVILSQVWDDLGCPGVEQGSIN